MSSDFSQSETTVQNIVLAQILHLAALCSILASEHISNKQINKPQPQHFQWDTHHQPGTDEGSTFERKTQGQQVQLSTNPLKPLERMHFPTWSSHTLKTNKHTGTSFCIHPSLRQYPFHTHASTPSWHTQLCRTHCPEQLHIDLPHILTLFCGTSLLSSPEDVSVSVSFSNLLPRLPF